jgi:hypothetical protein
VVGTQELKKRIDRLEQVTPDRSDKPSSPIGYLFGDQWRALEFLAGKVGWPEGERIAWLRFYDNAMQLLCRPEHLAARDRAQVDLSEVELAALDAMSENQLNSTPITPEMQAILDALLERSETLRATLDDKTLTALADYECLREGFIIEAGQEDFDRAGARFFLALRRIIEQGVSDRIAPLDLTDPLTLWSVGRWFCR